MPDPIAELQKAGATAAVSVGELAHACDVICVMVRDDDQVRDVLGEIYGSAKPGTTVVIHSTIAPETPVALESTARRHDLRLVDAPVSGGSMGAADGTLAIMVGGSDEAYESAKPVLDAMATIVTHAGPIGAGTKLKLARNLMHFVAFTAATEAQRLAEAAGLDLVELGNIVRHTDKVTGGPGAIMLRDTAKPIDADDFWHGVMSHVVALGEKDLSFAIRLGETLGVETPMAELALQRLAPGLGVEGTS
jgi:3-hydroxyisobutyrate dehydrogenase-like beta-hydroxyacid dehydrogenase